jgi:hypothetical protein
VSEHDDRPDEQPGPRPGSLWGTPDPEAAADAAVPPGTRPDPRLRPPDPAGTQPKFRPEDLLPHRPRTLRADHAAGVVEGDAVEDGERDAPADRDGDLLPERIEPAGGAASFAAHAEEPPHAPRFQFALGALIAVGVAAVAAVLAIAIGINDDNNRPASLASTWSSWRPIEGAGDGPTQIARHVANEYRLPEGDQLVAVTGGPMEIAGLPLTVALRQPASAGGDIELVDGQGVLFRMCGLAPPNCGILKGKPSRERHLLLRREALELALYSFRYIEGVDHAVVFMPPRAQKKGEKPMTQALFFRKRDLEGAIDRPLSATLTPSTPTVRSVAASPDAALVNTITTRMLFTSSLTQGNQDARAFLVLDPLETN